MTDTLKFVKLSLQQCGPGKDTAEKIIVKEKDQHNVTKRSVSSLKQKLTEEKGQRAATKHNLKSLNKQFETEKDQYTSTR